jgi:hypothetical protein
VKLCKSSNLALAVADEVRRDGRLELFPASDMVELDVFGSSMQMSFSPLRKEEIGSKKHNLRV